LSCIICKIEHVGITSLSLNSTFFKFPANIQKKTPLVAFNALGTMDDDDDITGVVFDEPKDFIKPDPEPRDDYYHRKQSYNGTYLIQLS